MLHDSFTRSGGHANNYGKLDLFWSGFATGETRSHQNHARPFLTDLGVSHGSLETGLDLETKDPTADPGVCSENYNIQFVLSI